MLDIIFLGFFQRALIVGLILGIVMALLGVIVVLRRLSFFSDAIGHSALTGIALGLLLNIRPFVAALVFTIFIALAIIGIRRSAKLHFDTILGVFFPSAMALGVILLQFTPGYQTDLIAFLFGDILTVGLFDVLISIILLAVALIMLVINRKKLLTITLSESLAASQGISIARHEIIFLSILAATIALAIKLVGIVLVTAMLIIPAASAQNIARSATSMIIISVFISTITVLIGMAISAFAQLPSGPTMVLTGAGLFALSFVLHVMRIRI